MTKFLVWQLALEDLAVSLAYAWQGDLPRTIYWGAAGVICLSTLWIGGR